MIGSRLTRYRDVGLLILRIGIGAAFIAHGWPKLTGGPKLWEGIGHALPLPAPVFWGFMAALAEGLGGLLFLTGFLFRPVCVLLLIDMLVAITFHLHSGNASMSSFSSGWSHPLEDAVVFLALIFVGPGKYSVDRV